MTSVSPRPKLTSVVWNLFFEYAEKAGKTPCVCTKFQLPDRVHCVHTDSEIFGVGPMKDVWVNSKAPCQEKFPKSGAKIPNSRIVESQARLKFQLNKKMPQALRVEFRSRFPHTSHTSIIATCQYLG